MQRLLLSLEGREVQGGEIFQRLCIHYYFRGYFWVHALNGQAYLSGWRQRNNAGFAAQYFGAAVFLYDYVRQRRKENTQKARIYARGVIESVWIDIDTDAAFLFV